MFVRCASPVSASTRVTGARRVLRPLIGGTMIRRI